MNARHTDFLDELMLLIRSRYGLICIETIEEERAGTLLRILAGRLNIPMFIWTRDSGLRREDLGKPIYNTADPARALAAINAGLVGAVYYMQDFGRYLDTPELQARLLTAAKRFNSQSGTLILTGKHFALNESVAKQAALVKIPKPQRADYHALLQQVYRDVSSRIQASYDLSSQEYERLLANLQGLTLCEAEKILTRAIVEDGKLDPADIQLVIRAKKDIVEKEGLLEYYSVEQAMADIADLKGLKGWLAKRKNIISDPEGARKYGLKFPKGILLLGVPGTGKSLCARAVANEWCMPLLKMDPANLYNKYIGESEKNFKRAMTTAEKIAPVVLLIDEIEKLFASGGGDEDGGTSARILGSFLSWLQDRRGDVFVVATANDVKRLPPEFLRKGRFDEIFFVDLPEGDVRAKLFSIHLERREQKPSNFDLDKLAAETDGFSGAEIEQVIVSALYTCFSDKQALTMKHLIHEARQTAPLSRTRAEHIASLRQWAQGRTTPAG